MTELECAGKKVQIDADGFLIDTEAWDEDVARALAEREGVEDFTDDKIEIVKFMRAYYQKFNAFPILNYVCKNIHQPRECVSEEFINPEKAWKIAGLPKQSGVHFVAVDGKHYLLEECCQKKPSNINLNQKKIKDEFIVGMFAAISKVELEHADFVGKLIGKKHNT